MNEPITTLIGTAAAVAVGAVGAVLVVTVASIYNRIRWRALKRHLSESDAAKECRDVVNDYIRTAHKENR